MLNTYFSVFALKNVSLKAGRYSGPQVYVPKYILKSSTDVIFCIGVEGGLRKAQHSGFFSVL